MLSYLNQVKANIDTWIATNQYQSYQFYIYSGIIFTTLYFSSSFINFFTRIPFLVMFSLISAYFLMSL